ncbi:MAG: hypothetical protein ACPL68_02985, partial [Candidatus Hydrothermia bacterium]
ATKQDEHYVIINGKEYGPYDYASRPEISSDGSTWGFRAVKQDEHYVIINGKEYGPFEGRPGITLERGEEGPHWRIVGAVPAKEAGFYYLRVHTVRF